MKRKAHDRLDKECLNSWHQDAGYSGQWFAPFEFNPRCQTCTVREILAEHDHLHLGFDEPKCETSGISGIPGSMVKCKCGAFHH